METKMPRKEGVGSGIFCFVMGMILCVAAIYFLFSAVGLIPAKAVLLKETFFNGVLAFGTFFYAFVFIFLATGNAKCYYCKKKTNSWQKSISIYWQEPTKYSDKEITVSETMHLKCHDKAEKKFKIADPRFSQIPI